MEDDGKILTECRLDAQITQSRALVAQHPPSDPAGVGDAGFRAEVEFLATRLQSLEGLGARLMAMENRPAPHPPASSSVTAEACLRICEAEVTGKFAEFEAAQSARVTQQVKDLIPRLGVRQEEYLANRAFCDEALEGLRAVILGLREVVLDIVNAHPHPGRALSRC